MDHPDASGRGSPGRRRDRLIGGRRAALTVVTAVSSSNAVALTDATTCSGWTAADPAQQTAYARRYVDVHRGTPRSARDAHAVTLAIDASCTHAAYLGESDDLSVVAAIRSEY